MTKVINKLDIKQSSLLCDLVNTEHVSKKLTDLAFAAYATNHLGFKVTEGNVRDRRYAFGIESTNNTKAVKINKLEELEERVSKLEAVLDLLDKKVYGR